MSVISSTWLVPKTTNEGPLECYWPGYFKSDQLREQATRNHLEISKKNCGVCKIRILSEASNYKEAQKAMDRLEFEKNTATEDDTSGEENNRTHRQKKNTQHPNYLYSFDSEEELIPQVPKPKISKITTKNVNDVSSTAMSVSCTQCLKNEGLISKLLVKLEKIEDSIKYLTILQQNQKGEQLIQTVEIKKLISKQDFEELNGKLSSPEEIASLVAALQLVGGKDTQDTTRRILNKLIDNNIALETNWSGKNNKICFSQYSNIVNLLTVSVRKNPICREATKNEIEKVIKVWLRNAADREGGRNRRKKVNEGLKAFEV